MEKNRWMTTAIALAFVLGVQAQGKNTGMGGDDGNYESLAERVFKLEKKTDAINVYFNYAASFQINDDGDHWGSTFKNKQARLEIKGNLTDKISYRFRHRLNKGNAAQDEDNFAKATDILMVGYQFNDKFGVQGGKLCQNWGGFEFDENPMYIYQYSDFIDYMDNFTAGVNISYKPVPTQELAINVANTYNNKFSTEYGDNVTAITSYENNAGSPSTRTVDGSSNPLTYIFLWNGSFFNNKLLTRSSVGLQTLAHHEYARKVMAGVQLNLPSLQWYVDYMGAWEGIDHEGIATADLHNSGIIYGADDFWLTDVHYNSFVTKANWQFAPKWNLMLKGMYETASVPKVEPMKDYRKSYGYMASVEYYPVNSQDFRMFLSYTGRKYDFKEKSGLEDYNTNRIELGFMYRLKIL